MQADLVILTANEVHDADLCVRCNYNLHGLPDQMACPECGLLVERSRHGSEHLTDASPAWLRGIAIGTSLILFALVLICVWIFAAQPTAAAVASTAKVVVVNGHYLIQATSPLIAIDTGVLILSVFDLCAASLLCGTLLLTRRQRGAGNPRDTVLRSTLRLSAAMPLIALCLLHLKYQITGLMLSSEVQAFAIIALITLGCAPFPALLFTYLRRLAKRVLHPGLAEHAAIVAVGLSLALAFVPFAVGLLMAAEGSDWLNHGFASLALPLTMLISLILFGGWSILNCIRFILAFSKAYRVAKRKWADADLNNDLRNDSSGTSDER